MTLAEIFENLVNKAKIKKWNGGISIMFRDSSEAMVLCEGRLGFIASGETFKKSITVRDFINELRK